MIFSLIYWRVFASIRGYKLLFCPALQPEVLRFLHGNIRDSAAPCGFAGNVSSEWTFIFGRLSTRPDEIDQLPRCARPQFPHGGILKR